MDLFGDFCVLLLFVQDRLSLFMFCKSVNKMAKFSEIEHSCCVFVCHIMNNFGQCRNIR